MSTPEVVEDTLDPLKIIDDFKAAHRDLLDGALHLHARPSFEGIVALDTRFDACKVAAQSIKQNGFFAEFGNVLFVTASVKAVVESGDELTRRASELRPSTDFENFAENIGSAIEFLITRDESIQVPDGLLPDNHEDITAQEVVSGTFETYQLILEQFEAAILSSESVSRHVDSIKEAIDRSKARKEAFKLYGGVVLAAFAGTFLANKFRKR